jgi:Mg2+ and Co2+ transporter CorA
LDVLGEYFEINVFALDKDEQPVELDLLAGRNWVATVHREPIAFIGEFRERLGPDTELGVLTAPSFIAALLDWQIGTYFASVDDLEHEVDRLDERALEEEDRNTVLREMLALRRRIGSVRRTLTPHREVFAALARPDFEVIASSESAPHFRAIADRLERAISAVENARELLIGSFDILMTREGQRTNDVMRVLTIISVILLPAVVLAGVMGMNFKVGFFEDPAMFWVVITAMVAIALVVLVLARRQRWI